MPPRLPRSTVRKGIKDGWIVAFVGHLRYLKCNGVLLSDMKIVLKSLEFYCRTFKIFKIQWSSMVDHENNLFNNLLEFYCRVLLSCWSSFFGYF
jgi:hypothetical protein